MKKIVCIICFMFLALPVKALQPTLNYQDRIYSNRIGDQNKIWSGQMAFIYMNGNTVYCLDPYLVVGGNYSINYDYHIDSKDLEYFEVVAYYGYSSKRNSIYYYMAAQELIWERILGTGKVFWTTGQYNTGEVINISKYKKEIVDDINNFYKGPSFNNSKYFIDSFSTIAIPDNNKVLNNYKVSNKDIRIENNNLIVTKNNPDTEEIVLERTINNGLTTKIYTSNGAQTLGEFGTNVTTKSKIILALDNYFTDVNIRFYDNETKEQIEPILCDNSLIKDEKNYLLKNVTYGKYTICLNDALYNEKELSFEIKDFKKGTNVDFYLNSKIKKVKNIPKKQVEKVSQNNETSEEKNLEIKKEELPNTSDVELPFNIIIFLLLMGGLYVKIW